MNLKHNDRVKYIGEWPEFGIKPGDILHCCGMYPQPPMKGWTDRDEISVYVDDPKDDFGGVVALPANNFEKVQS